MSNDTTLPFHWETSAAHYFTYYGDIYHGTIIWTLDRSYPFYIIPNYHLQEVYGLPPNERVHEKLSKLGHSIYHKDIVYERVSDAKRIGTSDPHESTLFGNKAYKRMFVFGAGASAFCAFGSGLERLRNSNFCPPLGTDLFNEAYSSTLNKYKGVRYNLPMFESRGRNIETCLEEDWGRILKSRNTLLTASHLNIQFCLRELFKSISVDVKENHSRYSLYNLFVRELQAHLAQNSKEQVAVVSFNYDTILDEIIEEAFGLNFENLKDYTNNEENDVVLFKPHGSCNWGWKFSPDILEAINPEEIPDYLYTQRTTPAELYYKFLGGQEMINTNSPGYEMNRETQLMRYTPNKNRIQVAGNNEMVFPALLLPYRDKDEFVMRYQQQSLLESWIDNIEEMTVIGWKGNEHLFNSILNKKSRPLKRLVIVNPDADAVKQNLSSYLDLENIKVVCINSFEEYVKEHLVFENGKGN